MQLAEHSKYFSTIIIWTTQNLTTTTPFESIQEYQFSYLITDTILITISLCIPEMTDPMLAIPASNHHTTLGYKATSTSRRSQRDAKKYKKVS
jgi:hypothetical protein